MMLHRVRYSYGEVVCLSVQLSVRDVEVPWSHRLEFFQKNFTISYAGVSLFADPTSRIYSNSKGNTMKFWPE